MLQAAEKLLGPYVWGRYDLLVLPPSFPYGGMENPMLTFVTPTLLAGDRSLTSVVIHEITHRSVYPGHAMSPFPIVCYGTQAGAPFPACFNLCVITATAVPAGLATW